MSYSVGDEVEVYIPRGSDPDHRYHGETGEVVDVLEDQLSEALETPERGYLYTVEFDSPEIDEADFRGDDLQRRQL